MTTSRTAGLRARLPSGLLGFVDDTSSRVASTGQTLGLRRGSPVRALPASAAYRLFDLIADVSVRRGGKGVDRLRANYARVRPELSTASSTTWCGPGCAPTCATTARPSASPSRRPGRAGGAVRIEGAERVREALAAGAAGRRLRRPPRQLRPRRRVVGGQHRPVTTVAERLEPEEVFQRVRRVPGVSIGMTIIPLTGGGDPFRALVRGHACGGRSSRSLADRDLTHNGVEVDLLRSPRPDGQGPGGARA